MQSKLTSLSTWYQENKRSLPWRSDKSLYHVWISEIMLQQTRIEAVIPYYQRFINTLSTIHALANIEEDKLLKLWEGLGYYSRAKNLKKAAQIIESEYQGIFPKNYEEILKLPGIGEYTASAIASICFNQKEVTIDGNVLRVYTRFFNDNRNIDDVKVKKEIRKHLMNLIPNDAGNFNQGMMELGETICLPKGLPKCQECPLNQACLAYKKNTYQTLPQKKKKITKKEEEYTILIYQYQNKYALYQRKEESLLQNLWSFPQLEGNITKKELVSYLEKNRISYSNIEEGINYTHIFTHKKWKMKSYKVVLKDINNLPYPFYSKEEIQKHHALASAYKPFLDASENDIH